MSERKVLNKYYPPDYDPSKVPRVKRKNKLTDVRIMAPFNMKCNTCGNYIASATKFNAKKETVEGETYKDLKIYRFYIKCPRCMGSIRYRTDLKESAYVVEQGATENFMALKMAERQAREEVAAEEEEEKIDPMKQLEKRTKASRQQMEASDHIQSLRSIKRSMDAVDIDSILETKQLDSPDDEIRAEAKRIYGKKVIVQSDASNSKLVVSRNSEGLTPALASLKRKLASRKPK